MNWCDVCFNKGRMTVLELDEDRVLMLCDECMESDLSREEQYDIVFKRRWKASKSDKQWNEWDPITDADRGIEPGTG